MMIDDDEWWQDDVATCWRQYVGDISDQFHVTAYPRDMGRIQRLTSVSMDAPTLPTDTVREPGLRTVTLFRVWRPWMEDEEVLIF